MWFPGASAVSMEVMSETHCGPVTQYGGIHVGPHRLRWWLVAWQHEAIAWTNMDLSTLGSSGIHLRILSSEDLECQLVNRIEKDIFEIASRSPRDQWVEIMGTWPQQNHKWRSVFLGHKRKVGEFYLTGSIEVCHHDSHSAVSFEKLVNLTTSALPRMKSTWNFCKGLW